MAVLDRQHPDIIQALEFLKLLSQYAILFNGAGADYFLAVTEEELDVIGRFAGGHVLDAHQRLAPGGFHDQVEV